MLVVSLFSLIAIIILAIGIITLGAQHKSFENKFTVNGLFNDVNGLKAGDNIWISGVKIGIVKKIELIEDGKVLITMSIEKKSRKYIHKDAAVKIGTDGLIGNKIIIIYGGTKNSPVIEDNEYLNIRQEAGTKDMMTMLDSASNNLLQITDNLKKITDKIINGHGTINTLLNDSTLSGNLKTTIHDARETAANLKNSSSSSIQMLNNLKAFSARLNQQGTSINRLLADTAIYNNISNSAAGLEETIDNLSAFAANIKAASDALNKNSDNITHVLLHDEAAAAALKSTIHNLDSASNKLNEDLEAVKHNFLLRGYFKKKPKQ
ncbi:phospholipid/cholesterol/gamma-HCH transport system substrate-binding protein [Chitinophaga dinghuensis]|uniref:Phospholipid/cholesterol/gamma-HCH transport system substrate-binding protein n=1 Tax=Chitinophaga dinghuensis TaxID=1539050 RepID=A0A327VTB0_9BACT|nr:phospholipid/cholesterol/gamma-HCH transport system substrate-binding protein [Chitinophaga dinghuensis]